LDNVVHIELLSATRPIDPKMLEDRRSLFKDKILALYENGLCIVKLIDIPVTKSVMYKSALDIINIIHFSQTESEEDDFNDNEELSGFEQLSMKIEKSSFKKLEEKTC
jgi:hypothetical protein